MNTSDFIRRVYFSRQFVKFVFVGGIALFLHWIARILLNIWTSYSIAIIVAYAVGMTVAYMLFRKFVFPPSGQSRRREIIYFFVVNIVSFPFVWAASKFLGDFVLAAIFHKESARAIGHGIAITLPVFANFLAHKFLTFKEA